MECGWIDVSACSAIGFQDFVSGCVIFVEDAGVPNDRGEIPLDRAEKGVLPIRPQQTERRVQKVAGMGVTVKRLERKGCERVDRGDEMVFQQSQRGRSKKFAPLQGFQQAQTLGEDGEFWKLSGERP